MSFSSLSPSSSDVEPLIEFLYEDTTFVLDEQQELLHWIEQVIIVHQFELVNLTYIFCSDPYLQQVNQEFLGKDYFTDIITFDNSDVADSIEGDIFISVDRVTENALERAIPFRDELHRVIIHGVLHLLGHTDKDLLSQTAMRHKEDSCLTLRAF